MQRTDGGGLGIGGETVGEARLLSTDPDEDLLVTLVALAALEVERTRSATWGNEEQAERLVSGLMEGAVDDVGTLVTEAEEIGCDLSRGAGFLMLKAHPGSAQEADWRSRVLDLVLRTARTAAGSASQFSRSWKPPMSLNTPRTTINEMI